MIEKKKSDSYNLINQCNILAEWLDQIAAHFF